MPLPIAGLLDLGLERKRVARRADFGAAVVLQRPKKRVQPAHLLYRSLLAIRRALAEMEAKRFLIQNSMRSLRRLG
jgi:hypothetical protein